MWWCLHIFCCILWEIFSCWKIRGHLSEFNRWLYNGLTCFPECNLKCSPVASGRLSEACRSHMQPPGLINAHRSIRKALLASLPDTSGGISVACWGHVLPLWSSEFLRTQQENIIQRSYWTHPADSLIQIKYPLRDLGTDPLQLLRSNCLFTGWINC